MKDPYSMMSDKEFMDSVEDKNNPTIEEKIELLGRAGAKLILHNAGLQEDINAVATTLSALAGLVAKIQAEVMRLGGNEEEADSIEERLKDFDARNQEFDV